MAISRMQQPRQMYGLGSFVKKAVGKVTKPFTKVAKKIVPKEVAGIMRAAAPFLPPGYREAAYLLGTAKQTGRISPIDLALTAAPTFFSKTDMGRGIAKSVGDFKLPGMERDLRTIAVGSPRKVDFTEIQGPTKDLVAGASELGGDTFVSKGLGGQNIVTEASQGIFGRGGEFNLLKGSALAKPDGTISPLKAGSVGVGVLSLIQNSKTPDEAGTALAAATGDSADYERGRLLFSQLTPELFAVPEEFRMNVQDGGIMRTNYARGSDDDEDKPVLPEDPTEPVNPFAPKPIKPLGEMKMAGSDRYQKILEEIINEMEGILGRELTDAEYDLAGQLAFDKFNSPKDLAVGGRVDYALGTRPTEQETGLGGLPIEADMRYTGGFMPYGAKEKADDVPARLSKNEFVFTADAVRAAGGGSVNEGAKKMYQTMKKLEAKPEAKGMTA